MEPRPYFTPEQIEWLCALIDDWYNVWEGRIHPIPFSYAKEVLKEFIYEKKYLEIIDER